MQHFKKVFPLLFSTASIFFLTSFKISQLPFIPGREKPEGLKIIEKSYPMTSFKSEYDEDAGDWKVTVTQTYGKTAKSTVLYYADGRMLPKEELANASKYWTLLYPYSFKMPEPEKLTEEEAEKIREQTSAEKRANLSGTPLFFFNAIYDADGRAKTESHLKKIKLFGKDSTVHEYIIPALRRAEARVLAESKTDQEVKFFLDQLLSAGAYNWREIRDRGSRSFHSYGIAIDFLPKKWGQKNIYWSWRRDIDPKNWMKLPMDRRWTPGERVIKIFEEEGFIWGGKWVIWDNMHFEYHPELIKFNSEVRGKN